MIPFLLIAIAISGAANIITIRALLRLHPRRRFTIALAIVGNVMWLFFPILNARTDFSRAMRAVFGPPWFAWLAFAIVYAIFFLCVSVFVFFHHGGAEKASRVFLIVTIVASVIGFYQAIVPLRVERVTIRISNLPPKAEGMRIALMGDLHVGLFTRPSRLTKIFSTVSELNPDVAIIAGDLIDDDPWFVPKLLHGTEALDPRIPLLGVLGNHEMYGQPFEAISDLRGSRIDLLVNDGRLVRGTWIAGLSDFAARDARLQPDLDAALRNAPAPAMPIVVAHQPKAFDPARTHRIALTLVAHTHGGQCGFRPLHWSLAGVFLPYHMGLYRKGGSQLYVNTGTGYWLVPFRLGMTPEITLIELRR